MQQHTQHEKGSTPSMGEHSSPHRRRNSSPQNKYQHGNEKLENGDLASNAKENMSVFGMHFHKVLNTHRPVNVSVLDLIGQKPCLTTIDAPITFREVKHAINKLKKGKAPGLNGIHPEALKAMNDTPQRTVHKHVSDFFEGKTDHEGWHKS
jgi:hypothetical protein